MKKNVILVVTYKAPEFLQILLESLIKCRGIEKYHICVAFKEDADPLIPDVATKLLTGLDFELKIFPGEWLAIRNVCEAYRYAFSLTDDYIIYLEEDWEVSRDFLEVLEYIADNFRDERLFGGFAGDILPGGVKTRRNIETLWISSIYHNSGGVLFKDIFDRNLSPYMSDEFYKTELLKDAGGPIYSPRFLNEAFPLILMPAYGTDGLLSRVLKHFRLYTLTAAVPRCHNLGFYGMHRIDISWEDFVLYKSLPFTTRVSLLHAAIESGAIREFFGTHADQYWEIEVDHSWDKLVVKSEGVF